MAEAMCITESTMKYNHDENPNVVYVESGFNPETFDHCRSIFFFICLNRMKKITDKALDQDKFARLKHFDGFVATTWNHSNLHWSLIVLDREGVIHWLDSMNMKFEPARMGSLSRYVRYPN